MPNKKTKGQNIVALESLLGCVSEFINNCRVIDDEHSIIVSFKKLICENLNIDKIEITTTAANTPPDIGISRKEWSNVRAVILYRNGEIIDKVDVEMGSQLLIMCTSLLDIKIGNIRLISKTKRQKHRILWILSSVLLLSLFILILNGILHPEVMLIIIFGVTAISPFFIFNRR